MPPRPVGYDADESRCAGGSEIVGEVDPPEVVGPHVARGPGDAPPQHPARAVDVDGRDEPAHPVDGQDQAAGGVEEVAVVDLAGVTDRKGVELVVVVVGCGAGRAVEQVGDAEGVARPDWIIIMVRHQVQDLAARGGDRLAGDRRRLAPPPRDGWSGPLDLRAGWC